ncbi:MAG: DUF6015 family protein [Thermoplasmatota archaeon]
MATAHDEMVESLVEMGNDGQRDALTQALKDQFNMEQEDAVAIAGVVSEQFSGREEVNDETLNPEVRSIFYTLEAKKLLSFRREEYSLETGERRRAFWWKLRSDELQRIVQMRSIVIEENVYDSLPKTAWSHRTAS